MRRKKVFGNIHSNGKVVTKEEAVKDYDKFPVVRDEDINWGLRVQANHLVFLLSYICSVIIDVSLSYTKLPTLQTRVYMGKIKINSVKNASSGDRTQYTFVICSEALLTVLTRHVLDL